MKPKIAILGGGITGMSAAWFLQRSRPEYDVYLFEQASRLGGVIATHSEDSWLIERGADNFATLIPDAMEMTRSMGLDQEMIHPNAENRLARVVRGGKTYPIPQGFSLMQPTRLDAIMASKVLSWPGKLRVASEYFIKRRDSTEDESLQQFAERRLGKEAFARLVEPIVGGIFTARADTLSMQAAMPEFVEMEKRHGGLIRSFLARRAAASTTKEAKAQFQAKQASGARYEQFVAPKLGMQWWLDEVTSRLTDTTIERGVEVIGLDRQNDRWWIRFSNREVFVAEGVVMALPAPSASRIMRSSFPEASELLRSIPYASSAVVAMVVRREEVPKELLCFGIVIPQIEGRNSLAISMSSEKYPGRVPKDHLLLRVFIGGAVRPELYQESDDSLLAMARKEVAELLQVKSPPLWQTVVRWPEAMPQYLVGHLDRIGKLEGIFASNPSLVFAGNAYRGVGIPQCVRSARLAVERLRV